MADKYPMTEAIGTDLRMRADHYFLFVSFPACEISFGQRELASEARNPGTRQISYIPPVIWTFILI
jgi:hypothetical protein